MASRIDILKWKLYKYKKYLLVRWGVINGHVKPYDKRLIENLRNVYFGGVPGSIALLCSPMVQGKCYDKSVFISLGFDDDDDFNIIKMGVDGIRLNPKYVDQNIKYPSKDYDSHSVALRIRPDGSRWIYDTSAGLVYAEWLYNLLQRPNVRNVRTKAETLVYAFCEEGYRKGDIDVIGDDIGVLPIILPQIETIASRTKMLYGNTLKHEIALLKDRVGFGSLSKPMDDFFGRNRN